MLHEEKYLGILIPTRNRASLLGSLLNSLREQTDHDFEVVVVDDGSEDETSQYLASLSDKSFGYRLVSRSQKQAGRPSALNKAIEITNSKFIMIMDDDDLLERDAVFQIKRMTSQLDSIESDSICGAVGLCSSLETGELIGDPFPASPWVVNYFDMRHVYGIRGDKKEIVKTKLAKQFRFPIFQGEGRVPTGLFWNHLARKHSMIFFNQQLCRKDYRLDGMTKNNSILRKSSPRSMSHYYRMLLEEFRSMPLRFKLRYSLRLMYYDRVIGGSLWFALRNAPRKCFSFILVPLLFYKLWTKDSYVP